MIFRVDSHEAWVRRHAQWQRWFAWFPVRVNEEHVTWLENVERRGSFLLCLWTWEYRSPREVVESNPCDPSTSSS